MRQKSGKPNIQYEILGAALVVSVGQRLLFCLKVFLPPVPRRKEILLRLPRTHSSL
jgi:hypothetical protein